MRDCFYPFVPMLVHQVVYHPSACLVEVGIKVGSAFAVFHLCNKEHLAFIGRELKAFDVSLVFRELLASGSVGIHFPQLVASALCGEESDFRASFYPSGFAFAGCGCGEQAVIASVGIHHVDNRMAGVVFHAVIRYGVSDLFPVGRHARASDASHSPQGFGSHPSVFNGYFLFPDKGFFGRCAGIGLPACGEQHGGGHGH